MKLSKIVIFTFTTLFFGVFITIFTGIFFNYPVYADLSGKYQFYINRGSPFIYSGVSETITTPPFPFIKVAAFKIIFPDGKEYVKLINLYGFLKDLAFNMILALIPTFILLRFQPPKKWIILSTLILTVLFYILINIWGQQY